MKKSIIALMLAAAIMLCMFSIGCAEKTVSHVLSVTAKTHVGDLGQLVDSFTVRLNEEFDFTGIDKDNILIENNTRHPYISDFSNGVIDVFCHNDLMKIDVDPFLFKQNFVVSCVRDGEMLFSFTINDVVSYTTDVADEFETILTDEALYRVYKPETDDKLPLIIWFHGAGERGNDGDAPLTDYRGAICWAEPAYQEKHPCIVLVPQIPADSTWDKTKLDDVRAVADELVASGIVDEKRIYAVGFSAYQATLWFATYNVDFVAAALHCLYWHAYDPDPKVGDEWSGIGWKEIADAKLPLWSVISTKDPTGATEEMEKYHIPYQLENNPNFRYTIWTEQEMYQYKLFGFLLHHGWVPAVNNQEMIDWLFAQSK